MDRFVPRDDGSRDMANAILTTMAGEAQPLPLPVIASEARPLPLPVIASEARPLPLPVIASEARQSMTHC